MTSRDKRPGNFAPPWVAIVTGSAQALRRQAEETLQQTVAEEPKHLAPMTLQ